MKLRVEQFLYCCVCVHCHGKVHTQPLPNNVERRTKQGDLICFLSIFRNMKCSSFLTDTRCVSFTNINTEMLYRITEYSDSPGKGIRISTTCGKTEYFRTNNDVTASTGVKVSVRLERQGSVRFLTHGLSSYLIGYGFMPNYLMDYSVRISGERRGMETASVTNVGSPHYSETHTV